MILFYNNLYINLNREKQFMQSERGIDWYQVSKVNCQTINPQEFGKIISVAHPEQGIDRVSLQYRKKLLVLFQKASQKIKAEIPHLQINCFQLQTKRNYVADQLHQLEAEAEHNFKEFTNLKFILNEKKRLKARLKEKIERKGFLEGKKVYCCVTCNRQGFETIQALKTHMLIEHRDGLEKTNQSSHQMNELKDLLMTMKDKQMEMMSMFLRASKEMQTEKLQKEYDKEYNKFMHFSGTKTEESKEEECVELKAQSQFLFFRKSQQFRREMEQDQQFRRIISKQKVQKQQSLQNQFYQQGNYYNVFGQVTQNKSEHFQQKRQTKQPKNEENPMKSYSYYDPNQVISKFQRHNESISRDSRYSLVQNTPKPRIQFKQQKTIREHQYVAPSISDRLRLLNKEKTHKSNGYQTMFSTKRRFYQDNGYVFNSGPLVDDKGGDSDYQDYFGKNKRLNISIEDQEIKLSFTNYNKTNLPQSKDSFHLSKLLSPKQNSSNSLYMDKGSKEKSSVIVDLSDSFSKRDFQISKDDQTINLSDLKLSKLQKKKEQEKTNKYKLVDKVQQITYSINTNKEVASTPFIKSKYLEKNEIQILKQYQKPIVNPMRQQQYKFTQSATYTNNFIKPNDRSNVLTTNRPKLNNQNSLGLLNEFFKDQFKVQNKKSVEKKESKVKSNELDQFLQK